MKITKVDVFEVHTRRPAWRPVLCRIYTDEGIYGDGEAALAYGTAAPAAAGMIRDLATLIIGMDPLDNEVIWDKLYKSTFWGQNGGPVVFSGISALDIALWDIKGKYFRVPIYKLLGGKRRDNLRTYASQLQFGWSDHAETLTTLDEYREVSKKAVAEGYDAIKIDFFTYAPEDGRRYTDEDCTRLLSPKLVEVVESRVAAVREAIGPNVDIIMENHSRPDAQSAVQLGRAVQKYNIFYFEEPNTPNPKTAKFISSKLSMPIAHGERVFTRWQYAPFFEDQSIQVIQPDLGNCGGLTEGKKICDMGHIYDTTAQIHVCGGPIMTAASLQLEAAIPNFAIHELHRYALLEGNRRTCKYDYMPVNGKYQIPDLPGIGQELTDECIAESPKVTVK